MNTSKRPVICLGSIDWDYLFHRPQQIMLGLAQEGHPVHFRNPLQIRGIRPQEAAPNLWIYRDFDLLPAGILDNAIYFVYFPVHASWIEPSDKKFVVYDCLDDFPDFAEHEDMMLARANLVLCCSESLLHKFSGRHQNLLLLPNGVDVGHYANNKAPVPPDLALIRSPGDVVIGFSGAFHSDWVDASLLYQVAKECPDRKFVIIGQNYGRDFSGRLQKAPPNVFYLGMKRYQELPGYLNNFDVGFIPFLNNRISRGADPVKLYEYLAAGLPVVSPDLPFTAGLAEPLVYTYKTKEDCLPAINKAVLSNRENGCQNQQLRVRHAAACSWTSRVQQLLAKLEEMT